MNRILAIGIDNYQHCNNLNNAVRDIQNTIDIILNKYDFDPDGLTALFDEKATRENIINQFESLTDLTADDTLLILFAGHGEYNKKIDQGYLITNETVPSNKSTYLEYSSIYNYLKAIEARHILLISDSCFSGSLFEQRRELVQEPNDRLDLIPSRWALTSGRVEPVLDGIPGQNSPFSISLQNSLKSNTKDLFSISELSNIIKNEVASKHIQIPRAEPIPIKGHKGGEFIFKLKLDKMHVSKFVEPKSNRLDELARTLKSNLDEIESSENAGKIGTVNKLKEEQNYINRFLHEEIKSQFEINLTSNLNVKTLFSELVDQEVLNKIEEIEKIIESKNDAVKNQQYDIAADLRDKQSKILRSISELFQDNFDINNIILNEQDIVKAYSIFKSWLYYSSIETEDNIIDKIKEIFIDLYEIKVFHDYKIIGLFEWDYKNREIRSKIFDLIYKIKRKESLVKELSFVVDKPIFHSTTEAKSQVQKLKTRPESISRIRRRK